MTFMLKKGGGARDKSLEKSLLGEDEETGSAPALHNINYVHQKLQGVKDIIVDKFHESI